MSLSTDVIIIAALGLFGLLTMGVMFARMYKRASKEVAFVRTGFGGQKVVMETGGLILPVLHEYVPVNMNTIRLEVARRNEQALITRDRMRVDVQAEFYLRVQPTADSVANAAQTLGRRTMNPEALKDLVEGKFVDALRAVAASMAMEELHEQRVHFVQKVQNAVSEDLLKNGLELETVSLTGLDQTKRDFFNPQNAFDAEGLTRLTGQIEARRKERNDIEQDTEVQVRQKNLAAERMKLELGREDEYARLEQQRELEIRRAEQAAQIAEERAKKQQLAEQAEIGARQQVELSRLDAERQTEEQRIAKERVVKERDVDRQRAIEVAEIERRKSVELTEQERAIAIAHKSKAQSEAQANADKARALAVQAEEQVTTMRDAERAEREKRIELIKAAEVAQRQAIGVTVAAEAEKQAMEDRAAALRTLAAAEGDKTRVEAQAAADAERAKADAAERLYAVEAAGRRAMNEAANVLSAASIALEIKLALLKAMPEIIAQSVRPLERIEGIRIMQVGGLTAVGNEAGGGASAQAGGASAGSRDGNLAEEVVRSALRYRAQAPLVDSLLGELGLKPGGDVTELARGVLNGESRELVDAGRAVDLG